jgi:hypothetical protein
MNTHVTIQVHEEAVQEAVPKKKRRAPSAKKVSTEATVRILCGECTKTFSTLKTAATHRKKRHPQPVNVTPAANTEASVEGEASTETPFEGEIFET